MAAQRDTTFFDADWDTVPNREGAAYFRLFDKEESSSEVYYFTDYYISGEKQAVISYLDPKGKKESGECSWYYKNGQISGKGTYLDGGKKGIGICYA